MKNEIHKLSYKKIGDTITDKEMCTEIIKAFNKADFGYFGNLSVQDICNWVHSVRKRILRLQMKKSNYLEKCMKIISCFAVL